VNVAAATPASIAAPPTTSGTVGASCCTPHPAAMPTMGTMGTRRTNGTTAPPGYRGSKEFQIP